MKLQFKHQQFQADAAKAVCDVFAGQSRHTECYLMDRGSVANKVGNLLEEKYFTGWHNHKLDASMDSKVVFQNIQNVQRNNNLSISPQLEGEYNLTIEMETGTGKTYTYIKTMYELHKAYGWSKFIIVVPSVAIREGVYKSFQVTEEHFMQEYGKKIRFFIYNSTNLTEIDRFASDPNINVMIINAQAFNARGKDARRIYMELDEFRSRRPIDILAKTNPILIIDEPQSVEGKVTKERLIEFNPLFTLRYSATHKKENLYNMIYRLDALDAYNNKLVKKIRVKGISVSGTTATEGYVFLESVNISDANPTATIEFDVKGKDRVRKTRVCVSEGFNLYDNSNKLEEYRNHYTISRIDGRDNSIEFVNGVKLFAGEIRGSVNEEQLRRIQIRETILSHIDQESFLFAKGIKVLSLFFIDEVAKYRQYENGIQTNGTYATIFEEEYNRIVDELKRNLVYHQGVMKDYLEYLTQYTASEVHAGYFSIDKNKNFTDGKIDRKEKTSDDVDAYDLIMRNKERLLSKEEPVRFIFSHSALREGWDNPNVFQICTLKQSDSVVRKRQEVGRGLRLCVNQAGERMDSQQLIEDVHKINILTVIASESYDNFTRSLQSEFAEAVGDRPQKVNQALFVGKVVVDTNGNKLAISDDLAQSIYDGMVMQGYVSKGVLTDKWFEDKKNNTVKIADEAKEFDQSVIKIIDSVYDPRALKPENAFDDNVKLKVDDQKLQSKAFKELWKYINSKSVYVVDFDSGELIEKAIEKLDSKLTINKIHIKIQLGEMNNINSKQDLLDGKSFVQKEETTNSVDDLIATGTEYDLLYSISKETGLTRREVATILKGIRPDVFEQFKYNPEDFIIKASSLINDEKATLIIEHITYNKLQETYDTNIFTEPQLKGKLGHNAIRTQRHLYDHLIYDSDNEKKFAEKMDVSDEVVMYVKLPKDFYITTPVGKYNPDWAITFNEEKVKHIYFVAETKGSMRSMDIREIEKAKIDCAKKHFKAISSGNIVYDVIDNYDNLLNMVMK